MLSVAWYVVGEEPHTGGEEPQGNAASGRRRNGGGNSRADHAGSLALWRGEERGARAVRGGTHAKKAPGPRPDAVAGRNGTDDPAGGRKAECGDDQSASARDVTGEYGGKQRNEGTPLPPTSRPLTTTRVGRTVAKLATVVAISTVRWRR